MSDTIPVIFKLMYSREYFQYPWGMPPAKDAEELVDRVLMECQQLRGDYFFYLFEDGIKRIESAPREKLIEYAEKIIAEESEYKVKLHPLKEVIVEPTDKQKALLRKLGLDVPATKSQATAMIGRALNKS